jgi:hypothetical protein
VSCTPGWALGFEDETWWSRFAQPSLHAWREPGCPLRLVEQAKPADDSDPQALACYGVLVRWMTGQAEWHEEVWVRFVDGRPLSDITCQFLAWGCSKLEAAGQRVWALIWDNASWHISQAVRGWIREHNRQVKQSGQGVRLLVCPLPVKSPWLNPIEPKWVHGKRQVAEPEGTLSALELADRVCAVFGCDHVEHLSVPDKVT